MPATIGSMMGAGIIDCGNSMNFASFEITFRPTASQWRPPTTGGPAALVRSIAAPRRIADIDNGSEAPPLTAALPAVAAAPIIEVPLIFPSPDAAAA